MFCVAYAHVNTTQCPVHRSNMYMVAAMAAEIAVAAAVVAVVEERRCSGGGSGGKRRGAEWSGR